MRPWCLGTGVATWATVCETAGSLPGAQLETGNDTNPAWRVNNRVIVRRNPVLDREEEGEVIAVRCQLAERAALLAESPAAFFLTEHWAKSRNPSILVRLTLVDEQQLGELITDAWRARATKKQQAALDSN